MGIIGICGDKSAHFLKYLSVPQSYPWILQISLCVKVLSVLFEKCVFLLESRIFTYLLSCNVYPAQVALIVENILCCMIHIYLLVSTH